MCPPPMCPWTKLFGQCLPWTVHLLDDVSLTDVSQPGPNYKHGLSQQLYTRRILLYVRQLPPQEGMDVTQRIIQGRQRQSTFVRPEGTQRSETNWHCTRRIMFILMDMQWTIGTIRLLNICRLSPSATLGIDHCSRSSYRGFDPWSSAPNPSHETHH